MKEAKNELMQFVAGAVMLAIGLFILAQKVEVWSGWFGGGFRIGSFRVNSGLVMIPFVIGIVWMFATGASFASKIFTGISILFIVVSIIMSTTIHLTRMSLYEWVLILVLIFGGIGFLAKVLLADSSRKKSSGSGKSENVNTTYNSIDEELEDIRKKMK